MNRQYRTVIVMAIAVATAALASFGVYTAIQRMPVQTGRGRARSRSSWSPPKRCLSAHRLRREQLKVVDWPAKTQVAGAFADPK